ncbi:DUF3617 domain-containing protein [Caldimonas brevitalea]|uniref:DUF3617 domain-containing protein n=1 Tax=Caldimonas brevitalea TaxID=413882 RepID=A0A0G3BHT0_9BURK|nr:DUF3617 domain-containing protein [Caldimonas brevitalea]AKJ26911.1 hypothetical protein AAW51_0220 [Caldimonas brevitalea]
MKHATPTALLCALVAALALPSAQAQSTLVKRKPGLWEVRQTHQSGQVSGQQMPSNKEMEAALATMTPAQRKQVEQTMRERGLGLSQKPGTMRYCLSPQMAERDPLSQPPDPSMKCDHKVDPVSGTEARFSFTCTGDQGAIKGDGRGWDLTAEGYKTSMAMQGTINGEPVSMKMEQSGRWLGSDCKGLKPLSP